MKTKTFVLTAVLVLIAVLSSTGFAQKKVAQAGLTFLKVGVGARAAAMGESYTAVANDANSIFWNPAGLTSIEDHEIALSYTDWIADLKHQSMAGAWHFENIGTFAVSLVYMDYGEPINYTRRNDSETGFEIGSTFSPLEYVAGIGYSRQFTDKFSMGVHIKYAYQGLGVSTVTSGTESKDVSNEVSALAVDFGTMYLTGIKDLRFAVSISNFSKDLKYQEEAFQLPLTFRMGLAMSVWNVENQSISLSVDAIHPRDFSEQVHSGVEYWYNDLFALRGGYKYNNDAKGLTFGAGLNYQISESAGTLVIDYAYSAFSDIFGAVNRFSLGYKF